jgi:hypothetical protein
MAVKRRFRRPVSKPGRRLAGLVFPLMLATAGVALAAPSAPTPGGHYVGKTSQNLAVNVHVASSGKEFRGGRLYFYLSGSGACVGRGYVFLAPTPPPAVKISSSGKVSFKSTFPTTPSPGFPFRGKGKVHIKAQFSQKGKVLSGTASEKLFNSAGSCTSGTVKFKATRKG